MRRREVPGVSLDAEEGTFLARTGWRLEWAKSLVSMLTDEHFRGIPDVHASHAKYGQLIIPHRAYSGLIKLTPEPIMLPEMYDCLFDRPGSLLRAMERLQAVMVIGLAQFDPDLRQPVLHTLATLAAEPTDENHTTVWNVFRAAMTEARRRRKGIRA